MAGKQLWMTSNSHDGMVYVSETENSRSILQLPEQEACRRLLAFDDMLAACKFALSCFGATGEDERSAASALAAAVAKAEGR